MAVSNLIRNRKRFMRECLDAESGEFIMNGQADGSVRIVDDYDAFCSDPDAALPKEYRMSLFPTNRRIVVYAARGGFFKDQFAYIPIDAIREITFNRGSTDKQEYCVTEFIAHRNSGFPSIVFKLDTTGHTSDLEQYMLVLLGFSKLAKVEITDYTAPKKFRKKRPQSAQPVVAKDTITPKLGRPANGIRPETVSKLEQEPPSDKLTSQTSKTIQIDEKAVNADGEKAPDLVSQLRQQQPVTKGGIRADTVMRDAAKDRRNKRK